MFQFRTVFWRLCAASCLFLLSACTHNAVDLNNLPCDDGQCLDGYACHPERNVCVPVVPLGCGSGGLCPSSVTVGDACSTEGTFIPCSDDTDTCEDGCRTCEQGSWGECRGATSCTVGTLDDCGYCGESCRDMVGNANPICNGSSGVNVCDYQGACGDGFADADGNRANGCECQTTAGGEEICDNIDNDCDGQVDEGVFACACTDGDPSTEVCDGIDNDCDGVIDNGFDCRGGELTDCDAGTGPGSGTQSCDVVSCTWSTTCRAKDAVPPAAVSDLAALPGDTIVDLSWTSPPDADLHECVVRRRQGTTPTGPTDGALVQRDISPAPDTAFGVQDMGLTNLVEYTYVVFCQDQSGNWQTNIGDGNRVTVEPRGIPPAPVTNLEATDGADGESQVTYVTPDPPMAECRLLRRADQFPAGHDDNLAVLLDVTETPTTGVQVVDDELVNGETYYYAAFCRNGTVWNDDLTTDPNGPHNASTAVPLDPPPENPVLAATSGESAQVTVTYAMPADADECVLRRASGDQAPASRNDGQAVGGPAGGSPNVVVVDTGVTNGSVWSYSAFCRNGTTWNEVLGDDNQASALPIAAVQNLVLGGGQDQNVSVSFTAPSGAVACRVYRRSDGEYPTGLVSEQVGAEVLIDDPPTVALNDATVQNGRQYHYAAYCRVDDVYRHVVPDDGENAGAVWTAPCDVGVSVAPVCDGGLNDVVAMDVVLDAACETTLTSFTVVANPNGTATESTTGRLQMVRDVDNSGAMSAGDTPFDENGDLLQGDPGAPLSWEFSGTATLDEGANRFLVLVYADAQFPGLLALEVATASAVQLAQGGAVIDAGFPGASGVASLGAEICTGADEPSHFGPGTIAPERAQSLDGVPGANDTEMVLRAEATGTLVDCQREELDPGEEFLLQSVDDDYRALRIDTGVPLGLPVCALRVRVHSQRVALHNGRCDGNSIALSGLERLVVAPYTTAVGVNASQLQQVDLSSVSTESDPVCRLNGNRYYPEYYTIDLTQMYQGVAPNDTLTDFSIRMVGIEEDHPVPLITEIVVSTEAAAAVTPGGG